MILVEPTNISFGEMIGDCQDSLTFELGGPPGMDKKLQFTLLHSLALQVKLAQILSGMFFGNTSLIKVLQR